MSNKTSILAAFISDTKSKLSPNIGHKIRPYHINVTLT